MKNAMLIFELAADFGSIRLIQISDYFIFTSGDTRIEDLNNENAYNELVKDSKYFLTFDDAMNCPLGKDWIFTFSPIRINAEYKSKLSEYYNLFKLSYGINRNWNGEVWERFLK